MNKIESGLKLDFNNVLIRPKRSTLNSRSEVNLTRKFKFINARKEIIIENNTHKQYKSIEWTGTPIIAANMDTTGTFEVYDVLSKYNIITALHKFYNVDEIVEKCQERGDEMNPDLFMISTGINNGSIEYLTEVFSKIKCNWICIDIANGYMSRLVDFCREIREKFPDKIIVAGNVVTREIVEELILNGKVDIVKIGIGSGAVCTTRVKTGVGMPQVSAVIECADAAHGVGGHIISDGGITCPGDMSKAYGAGADFVMAGGIFSGHDENPGKIIEENGNKYKMFYGMSSKFAMEKHFGSMKTYRSSEGRCLKVKYRGSLNNTVLDYLGGLRSTCTYINAPSIKEMAKCTTFMQVSQQINTSLL